MTVFLIKGMVLGLSAGLSPGPLLTLVVSETIRSGPSAGFRVALAPLITDAPMIVLCLAMLGAVAGMAPVIGGIGLAGSILLMAMGIGQLRIREVPNVESTHQGRPLLKGILANALNPNPYLFWLTIGAPLLMDALSERFIDAAAFLGVFYGCLVGSKLALAAWVGRFRRFVSGRYYVWIMRVLGCVLIGFGMAVLKDALTLLISGTA